MTLKGQTLYEFGSFRLDPANRQLLDEGRAVSLTPKALEILVVLVQNGNRLTTKEELMRRVWPDSFVEEANLTVNISALRKLLGETVDGEQYIQTVPKSGYRFSVPVTQRQPESQAVTAEVIANPLGEQAAASENIPSDGAGRPAASVAPGLPGSRWILTSGILLVGIIALGYTAYRARTPRRPTAISIEPRSLAILPLQNLRQDPNSEFLGFSLSDAVITKLDYVSSLTVR